MQMHVSASPFEIVRPASPDALKKGPLSMPVIKLFAVVAFTLSSVSLASAADYAAKPPRYRKGFDHPVRNGRTFDLRGLAGM